MWSRPPAIEEEYLPSAAAGKFSSEREMLKLFTVMEHALAALPTGRTTFSADMEHPHEHREIIII